VNRSRDRLLPGDGQPPQGEVAKARDWYERSTAWMEKHESKDRFLIQYRAEAAALLGISRSESNHE
jgi:hypothetical protein